MHNNFMHVKASVKETKTSLFSVLEIIAIVTVLPTIDKSGVFPLKVLESFRNGI